MDGLLHAWDEILQWYSGVGGEGGDPISAAPTQLYELYSLAPKTVEPMHVIMNTLYHVTLYAAVSMHAACEF